MWCFVKLPARPIWSSIVAVTYDYEDNRCISAIQRWSLLELFVSTWLCSWSKCTEHAGNLQGQILLPILIFYHPTSVLYTHELLQLNAAGTEWVICKTQAMEIGSMEGLSSVKGKFSLSVTYCGRRKRGNYTWDDKSICSTYVSFTIQYITANAKMSILGILIQIALNQHNFQRNLTADSLCLK